MGVNGCPVDRGLTVTGVNRRKPTFVGEWLPTWLPYEELAPPVGISEGGRVAIAIRQLRSVSGPTIAPSQREISVR
jgi:hypothetical protein